MCGYACLDELVFVSTFLHTQTHIVRVSHFCYIEMACNASVVNLHISFPKMRISIIAIEVQLYWNIFPRKVKNAKSRRREKREEVKKLYISNRNECVPKVCEAMTTFEFP